MIYKIGILGASGRMGQEISAVLAADPVVGGDQFEVCDGITQSGRVQSVDGIELRTMQDPPREPVHGWIDFSRPEATLALLEKVRVPVLIGTTGFTPEQLRRIEARATEIPILLAANTSVGVNWFTQVLEHGPRLAKHGFVAELSEAHHKNKKDSPSGTAKRLLQSLESVGYAQAPVHVTRAGSIVGTHTVSFIADGEEITITHRATDRRVFAKGALAGMHFLLRQKTPRLYRFEEVLQ